MPSFETAVLSFRWEATGDRREIDVHLTSCLITASSAEGCERCAISATGHIAADIGISYLKRVARREGAVPACLRLRIGGDDVRIVGNFLIGMHQVSSDGSLWRISLADEAARFHDSHVANAA